MNYNILVTDHSGQEHELEATPGFTIMEIIRDAGLDLEAICGGCCACATCHVYGGNAWANKVLIEQNSLEQELLEYEKGYKEGMSRLGCQIMLDKSLDGITLHLRQEELL